MNSRALLACVSATFCAGCLTDTPTGSPDPETTAVGADESPDDAASTDDDTPAETSTLSTGPGTLGVDNETDYRLDVRVELYAVDENDSVFLGYVLVEPGTTETRGYATAGDGNYRAVATLPTLGDRDVNWTATESWTVVSAADPGTVAVRITTSGLAVAVE